MKKALLYPLFALSLWALPSCANSVPNQGSVEAVKELLGKQDLSPVMEKIFTATFFQNYDVFSSTHQENRNATRFHSYRGGGAFGCAYKVTSEAYEEVMKQDSPDFFDFFARGEGGYGLLQSANVSSYFYERDGEDVRSEAAKTENFLQNIQVNFGSEDVQVASSLLYSEGSEGSNTRTQSFNGLSSKETLFGSISVRSLSDLFARTNLYDGQRSCEILDRLYEDTLRDLTKYSDKQLSDFILSNHVEVQENEENTLVSFELMDEGIRSFLSEKDIIPGTLKGTLTYDKVSGAFQGFDYKIVHIQDEKDLETGHVYGASMEFSAVGYSKNEEFEGDMHITPNPQVYEDGDRFVADMVVGIIPEIS